MNSANKKEWVATFAQLFGFKGEDLTQIKAWLDEFPIFSVQELDAGTEILLKKPDLPAARHQVLRSLVWAIREAEALVARPSRAFDSNRSDCRYCHGFALVVVPRHVKEYRWVPYVGTRNQRAHYYTCAVTCRCSKGKEQQARSHAGSGKMSLDNYEKICPAWKEELERVAREFEAMKSAPDLNHGEIPEELKRAVQEMRSASKRDDGKHASTSFDHLVSKLIAMRDRVREKEPDSEVPF